MLEYSREETIADQLVFLSMQVVELDLDLNGSFYQDELVFVRDAAFPCQALLFGELDDLWVKE